MKNVRKNNDSMQKFDALHAVGGGRALDTGARCQPTAPGGGGLSGYATKNSAKVVILNWNGERILPRFLPSVVAGTPPEIEIVVADNGSTDGSVELLKRDFPTVRLVLLERNFGFAEGYNRAIAALENEDRATKNMNATDPAQEAASGAMPHGVGTPTAIQFGLLDPNLDLSAQRGGSRQFAGSGDCVRVYFAKRAGKIENAETKK